MYTPSPHFRQAGLGQASEPSGLLMISAYLFGVYIFRSKCRAIVNDFEPTAFHFFWERPPFRQAIKTWGLLMILTRKRSPFSGNTSFSVRR